MALTFRFYFVIFIANVTGVTENWICDRLLPGTAPHDKGRTNILDGPGRREAAISHARGFRLIEVLSGRRETHSRYLWNIECECRASSKCAVVSAAPGGGLATLHLRHLSAVSGRSYGEWILHSKLHLPALLAIHSAALARRANDVVDRLKQHGDPWRLSEELPPPTKGHSTQ